jgi:predicted nucleotidyltransferase
MNEIHSIAKRIAAKFDVEKIILFGSYAYGKPTEGSDVDLLVIMKHNKKSNRKQMFEIADALAPRLIPMDIVVRTPRDLRVRIPQGDWFLKDIVEKGKVLIDRSRS